MKERSNGVPPSHSYMKFSKIRSELSSKEANLWETLQVATGIPCSLMIFRPAFSGPVMHQRTRTGQEHLASGRQEKNESHCSQFIARKKVSRF